MRILLYLFGMGLLVAVILAVLNATYFGPERCVVDRADKPLGNEPAAIQMDAIQKCLPHANG